MGKSVAFNKYKMPPKKHRSATKPAVPKFNCRNCGSFLRKDMGCTNCERAPTDVQPWIAPKRHSKVDHKVFDQLHARAAAFF